MDLTRKNLLAKLKLMLAASVILAELKTEDGATLFAENFEVGSPVFIMEGEEQVPAPAGDYKLDDGKTLKIGEDGLITEMVEAVPEESLEELKGLQESIQKMLDAHKLEKEAALAEQKKIAAELAAANLKLSKTPAVPFIKKSPEGKTRVNLGKQNNEINPRETRRRVYERLARTAWDNAMIKLATTVSNTTTYAGEFAGMYIAAALLEGVTLASNMLTIKPNIKYEETVKRVATSGIITDQTCEFTPVGDVTLDERKLKPKPLQVNLNLCKEDFQNDWDAISMGYSAFDQLPPTFQQFFIAQLIAIVAEANENTIYQGVVSNEGEYDGFETLMAADGDVITVDSTAITPANVIDELGKVADAIPQKVYNTDDLYIYVATNVYRAYSRALGGFGAAGLGGSGYQAQGTVGAKPLDFDGIPLFIANGMTSGKMIAAQVRNMWFGTGLMSDQNEVKVIDTADILGDKNVRFIMRYTGAVQYGISDEIVYYRPTV